MKLYERIENNNFDEIDRNRAIELIEGGNGHLVYNENYFKLQKENEQLKKQVQRQINKWNKDIKSNYISKHEVKDKIEELDKKVKNYQCVENKINLYQRKVLQELLEEGEKNGKNKR